MEGLRAFNQRELVDHPLCQTEECPLLRGQVCFPASQAAARVLGSLPFPGRHPQVPTTQRQRTVTALGEDPPWGGEGGESPEEALPPATCPGASVHPGQPKSPVPPPALGTCPVVPRAETREDLGDTGTVEMKSLPHPTRCQLVKFILWAPKQCGQGLLPPDSAHVTQRTWRAGGEGPFSWRTAVKRDASSPDIILRARKLDARQGSARSHVALRPIRFIPGPLRKNKMNNLSPHSTNTH